MHCMRTVLVRNADRVRELQRLGAVLCAGARRMLRRHRRRTRNGCARLQWQQHAQQRCDDDSGERAHVRTIPIFPTGLQACILVRRLAFIATDASRHQRRR